MSKKIVSLVLAVIMTLTAVMPLVVVPAAADTGAVVLTDDFLSRWAVKKGILAEGAYNPSEIETVDGFIYGLWVLNGRPAVASKGRHTGSCAEALDWADSRSIHSTPNTRFLPDGDIVTRIQCLYMIYLLDGKNTGTGTVHYTDTYKSAYYIKALDWCYRNNLCDKNEGGKFNPHANCKMHDAMTFLYLYAAAFAPEEKLSDFKWLAFGNSLTDDTGDCGKMAPNKYHKIISEATGMKVEVKAMGGTGYWRSSEKGTCYYQRMQKLDADPDVDVVTIMGSVNDWRFWNGGSRKEESTYTIKTMGLDKDGNPYTFAEFHRVYGTNARVTKALAAKHLAFTDTVASTENKQYGISWVAYVNECINTAHEKFPNAKIVLVDEIYFVDTRFYDIQEDLRNIKKALVDYRTANGDDWLSLAAIEECTFEGLDVPERKYVNAVAGKGLSFDQLTDSSFLSYYTYDRKGHPNDLYHRIWLAPVYANVLCGVLGVDPETLPPELRMD